MRSRERRGGRIHPWSPLRGASTPLRGPLTTQVSNHRIAYFSTITVLSLTFATAASNFSFTATFIFAEQLYLLQIPSISNFWDFLSTLVIHSSTIQQAILSLLQLLDPLKKDNVFDQNELFCFTSYSTVPPFWSQSICIHP